MGLINVPVVHIVLYSRDYVFKHHIRSDFYETQTSKRYLVALVERLVIFNDYTAKV